MAERVGFEPTRRFPAYLISSQAPSTELGHLSMLLGLIYCIGLALALSRFGLVFSWSLADVVFNLSISQKG